MAFKMKGSPMQRNFGVSSPKIPEGGTGRDDETGTYYHNGMAIKEGSTEAGYSAVEAKAAEELDSGRVNRAHRRHKRKSQKDRKPGQERRNRRKHTRTVKAKERAEELTAKRFGKTDNTGQEGYNEIIEEENRKRRERENEKNKPANPTIKASF